MKKKIIEKLMWFNKIINRALGKNQLDVDDYDMGIEKERSDFYSRFFCFIVNKLSYSDNNYKIFNNREYLSELLKCLTNPNSFADRFVSLKTFTNVSQANFRLC